MHALYHYHFTLGKDYPILPFMYRGEINYGSGRGLENRETEPFAHYPILITGAGHGTGLEVAKKFAQEGYVVYIGTRSQKNFDEIRQNIIATGGTEPKPFIADFTKPGEIREAYHSLGIERGQRIHYFPFAAAGFEKMKRPLLEELASLREALDNGTLTDELKLKATKNIRDIAITVAVREPANTVNRDGPLELGNYLAENENLGPGSVIVTLSSMISDYVNQKDLMSFLGPWFYFSIGASKAELVQGMTDLAGSTKAGYLDMIAPLIRETVMAKLIKRFLPFIQKLEPDKEIILPEVSVDQVNSAIYQELTRNDPSLPSIRKVYIPQSGIPSSVRPPDWKIPVFRYL